MNLVKDLDGESNIESIQGKIGDLLSVIEGWLCIITPYNYVFKKIIPDKLWPE
jgi:hypothetical protein